MTLQELSDAWNALRAATVGRGSRPKVSSELADRIAEQHEAFRAWLADNGFTGDLLSSVSASEWVDEYRGLVELAQREGVAVSSPLPATPYERTQVTLVSSAAVLGVAAIAALAFVLGRRK